METLETHWNSLWLFETHEVSLRLTEPHWDSLKLIETLWDSWGLIETHWDSLKLIETHWDSLRLTETHWDSMQFMETHWNSLRRIKTHEDSLRLIETHLNLLRLLLAEEEEKDRIIEKHGSLRKIFTKRNKTFQQMERNTGRNHKIGKNDQMVEKIEREKVLWKWNEKLARIRSALAEPRALKNSSYRVSHSALVILNWLFWTQELDIDK